MSYIESRRAGRDALLLFVAGPDDNRKWLWWINRIDAADEHAYFGMMIAHGQADSRAGAMRAMEHAYHTQVRKPRRTVRPAI